MNDVMRELWNLKPAVVVGIVIYAMLLLAMYAYIIQKSRPVCTAI